MLLNDLPTETRYYVHDYFVKMLYDKNIPVKIFLRSGIALQGYIEAFDQDVILLKDEECQLIYKNYIATIMPTIDVKNIKK